MPSALDQIPKAELQRLILQTIREAAETGELTGSDLPRFTENTPGDIDDHLANLDQNNKHLNEGSGGTGIAVSVDENTGQASIALDLTWSTWTPTVTAAGSGVYTASVATNQKSRWRYCVIGKTAFFNCAERFNLTVAASAYIDISLPSGITIPADDAADTMPSGQSTGIYYDGSNRTGPLNVRGASPSGTSFTSIRLFRLRDAAATANWSVNNGSNFRFTFAHEID